MEDNFASVLDGIDVDIDDEDWNPTPAGHLMDALEAAENALRETNRAAAAQMAAIYSAVEAGRQAPDVYVDELFSGSARGRELVVRSVVFDLSVRLGMSTVTVRTLADRAERLQTRLPLAYAITYPDNSTYRYLCGIPDSSAIAAPDNFERVTIPAGTYIVFDHVGPTIRLAATMSMIYRRVLPELGLQPARGGIFHFERYDHRFHWNRASSIIEIWVPDHRLALVPLGRHGLQHPTRFCRT